MASPDLSYQSENMVEIVQGQLRAADALLLGRVTYQEFAAFWPFQTNVQAGMADYINKVAKFVISSTLDKANWHNTTILSGNAICWLVPARPALLERRRGLAL